MLIPCSDPGLAAALEHYDRLSSLLHIGCPPPDIVRSVLDKGKTIQAARGLRHPYPGNPALCPTCGLWKASVIGCSFPSSPSRSAKRTRAGTPSKCNTSPPMRICGMHFSWILHSGLQNLLQEFCPGDGVGIEILFHQQPAADHVSAPQDQGVPGHRGAVA